MVVTNGGSIPCTDAIISVTAAAGVQSTAITLSANVCQITWTGTLAENKRSSSTAAQKRTQQLQPAYSGLSFGAQHHTHEWFILNRAPTIPSQLRPRQTEPIRLSRFPFGAVGMSNTVWANVETVEWRVQGIGHWSCCHSATQSGLTGLDRFRLPFPASRVVPTWIKPRRYIRAYGMVGDSATPNVTELRHWHRGQHHAQ